MDTQYLLDLDGQSGPVSDDLTFFIRAKVADNELGVGYALVLLRNDEEILKFDNSHVHKHLTIKSHIHQKGEIVEHRFETVYELVEAFFTEANRLAKELK